MGRPPGNRKCGNDWCTRKHYARGYCHTCYMRGWSSGDSARGRVIHRAWEIGRTDVDEAAVRRLVSGDPPARTTLGDREEAVRRLHAYGLNDRQIADRLRRRTLYVWRVRERLGLRANQYGSARAGEVYVTGHLARARLRTIERSLRPRQAA